VTGVVAVVTTATATATAAASGIAEHAHARAHDSEQPLCYLGANAGAQAPVLINAAQHTADGVSQQWMGRLDGDERWGANW
jgi:hypothetical protein